MAKTSPPDNIIIYLCDEIISSLGGRAATSPPRVIELCVRARNVLFFVQLVRFGDRAREKKKKRKKIVREKIQIENSRGTTTMQLPPARVRNRGFQPTARRCTTGYRVKIFRPTRRAHTAVTFCKMYIHRFSIPCIPYANNNLETSHSPSSRIHALAHHHTNEWNAPRNNDLVVPVKIIPIDRFIKNALSTTRVS